jgi:bifunctional UDP-N-acetylglucosamine pyrophosphorylase/glucosamine-1-phosphate N-acetyltransferase
VVTATVERPYGYGRIVRVDGAIARIVEERDASPSERHIREINSGIYAFDMAPLFEALQGVAAQNAQGEYYLTDVIAIYRRRKLPVETCSVDDPQEVRGVNSRTELAEVSRLVRQHKNEELMASGVTLIDPAATFIDPYVVVGSDTVIHPGVVLQGKTKIGSACPTPKSGTTPASRASVSSSRHASMPARPSGPSLTSGRNRRSARARRSATSSS